MKTYIGGEIISPAFRLSETVKYQIKTAIQVLMKRARDGDLSAYDDVSSLVESLDSGWCQVIDSLQGQLTDHAMVCTAHRAFLDETVAAPQQPPVTAPESDPELASAETVQQITEEYRRDPSSFGLGITRKRS